MIRRTAVAWSLGVGLALGLFWLLGLQAGASTAAPGGPAAKLRVCPAGPPTCDYASIQAAVDAANLGDVIKVAQGTYSDIHTIPELGTGVFTATQVVAITKAINLRGGYTTADWVTPDPEAHPTILDAERKGRVLVVIGDFTASFRGFALTNGDATGLGGKPWGDVGGGVFVNRATVEMKDSRIYGNASPESGGGLYLLSSNATLSNNAIYSNTTGWSGGGGMKVDGGTAVISNNSIFDNAGGWGGGVYLSYSNITFEGNAVYGNTGGYGGGLNLDRGEIVLNNNHIFDNTASRGGGLYFYVSSPTLTNNIISGNTCSDLGGGIYLYSSASVLTNNVVVGNATSQDTALGAGMYVCSRSSPTLLHNTIARNKGGDGVGIYVDEWYGDFSSIVMTNTIIAGHTTGVMVTPGNTATLASTLWHDNTADRHGGGLVNHTDDHTGDPKFAFDGYHLLSGSAAIDKGVNAGVTRDIDGDARPHGQGYDLGADEFGPVAARHHFLPLAVRTRQ